MPICSFKVFYSLDWREVATTSLTYINLYVNFPVVSLSQLKEKKWRKKGEGACPETWKDLNKEESWIDLWVRELFWWLGLEGEGVTPFFPEMKDSVYWYWRRDPDSKIHRSNMLGTWIRGLLAFNHDKAPLYGRLSAGLHIIHMM